MEQANQRFGQIKEALDLMDDNRILLKRIKNINFLRCDIAKFEEAYRSTKIKKVEFFNAISSIPVIENFSTYFANFLNENYSTIMPLFYAYLKKDEKKNQALFNDSVEDFIKALNGGFNG